MTRAHYRAAIEEEYQRWLKVVYRRDMDERVEPHIKRAFMSGVLIGVKITYGEADMNIAEAAADACKELA